MYRGTTPTVTYKNIPETIDLDKIKQIWITFKDSKTEITKYYDDVTIDTENRTISVTLTQEDTLAFKAGTVNNQLRILMKDGSALATSIKTCKMNKILKEGVIDG